VVLYYLPLLQIVPSVADNVVASNASLYEEEEEENVDDVANLTSGRVCECIFDIHGATFATKMC
jgi:hypothetical protein